MQIYQLPNISNLKTIKADKGNVVKFSHSKVLINKRNENGEYYFTSITSNSSKRWRKHQRANLYVFSILGTCLIDWKCPKTQLIKTFTLTSAINGDLEETNYPILSLPAKIEFRMRNMTNKISLLACFSDISHIPSELNSGDML